MEQTPNDNDETFVMIDPAKGYVPGNVLIFSYKDSLRLLAIEQRIALKAKMAGLPGGTRRLNHLPEIT